LHLFELAEDQNAVNRLAFRCGQHEFVDTEEQTWAFLVKLGPDRTGRRDTMILLWGLGAVGTAAAAYFLSEFPDKLPGRHGESFFVAIPVQRDLGYRGVSQSTVDLSSEAFVSGGQPGASR
jgi:hypothetical protein